MSSSEEPRFKLEVGRLRGGTEPRERGNHAREILHWTSTESSAAPLTVINSAASVIIAGFTL